MTTVFEALSATLEDRKDADPDKSYVASLYVSGLNKILEKVGEEATETILAAKDYDHSDKTRDALLGEMADLWFHSLVVLAHLGLDQQDVMAVLAGRFDLSGLEEKAARTGHNAPP